MSVNGSDILSALNAGSGINAKNLVISWSPLSARLVSL